MKLRAILLAAALLIVGMATAQAPYTPPVFPPLFNSSDMSNSTLLMANVNANVDVLTKRLLKHDADLYSPSGSVATALRAIPAVNLPTATVFPIPACRFSGIYGNIAQVTEPSRDTDGGCSVGWIQPGEHLLYTFYVPVAGNYAVSARVASPLATGAFHMEMDGMSVTPSVSVPNTAGWYVWQTVAVQPFMLPAGIVTVSVVVETGAQNNLFNLHWMNFAKQ